MIERFSGSDGRRLVVEALSQQGIVQGDHDLATQLAGVVEIVPCKLGSPLIAQDGTDNDLYFILAGRFSVQVNGREVARRVARQHVGEMALIDPKARRSASVIALEESVVAKVSERALSDLA